MLKNEMKLMTTRNFLGWGSWAVKESESEQDQDDVDTKCYSLTDQENF